MREKGDAYRHIFSPLATPLAAHHAGRSWQLRLRSPPVPPICPVDGSVNITPTRIPDVLLIEPTVYGDHRGFFIETYHRRKFADAGLDATFVQDNLSRSRQGILRGLHYQLHQPQGKLVRAVRGEVYDVAVDLRRGSATFGQWVGVTLSEENHRSVYIPPGFAHGFCVVSNVADVFYKCTDLYAPEHERTLLWNDPQLGIDWPLTGDPVLSDKDRRGVPLSEAETFA